MLKLFPLLRTTAVLSFFFSPLTDIRPEKKRNPIISVSYYFASEQYYNSSLILLLHFADMNRDLGKILQSEN